MSERCRNVGELVVGGKMVGLIKCELDAGHEHPIILGWESEDPAAPPRLSDPIPHRATLEWTDPAIDWPEANDPDEVFDVEVPMPTGRVDFGLKPNDRAPIFGGSDDDGL